MRRGRLPTELRLPRELVAVGQLQAEDGFSRACSWSVAQCGLDRTHHQLHHVSLIFLHALTILKSDQKKIVSVDTIYLLNLCYVY